MSAAIPALRAAIHAVLSGDAALTALIGPRRIHHEPPRAQRGVYVVHGDVAARDWSTGSDSGCEQDVSLVVWGAESGSSRLALDAAGLIVTALDQATPTLAGHRLINLTWLASTLGRDPATNLPKVTLRFRATTETL